MAEQSDDRPPILGDGYHVVDLTVLLAEDLPSYWPAHLPFQHKVWNWFGAESHPAGPLQSRSGAYATKWMAIDEHTGTHMDAPSHFIPPPGSGYEFAGALGGVSVEQIPVETTMGAAAVLDIAALSDQERTPGLSPLLTAAGVEAWEAVHGRLTAGDIVLIHTGWDRWYVRGPEASGYAADVLAGHKPGWPAPDGAAIRLMVDRGVRCIGIDAPTMGPAQGGQDVHVAGLGAGAVFIECLAHLEQLPPRGAWFCFLPIRLEGGTGAPGRAVAWVPCDRQQPSPGREASSA